MKNPNRNQKKHRSIMGMWTCYCPLCGGPFEAPKPPSGFYEPTYLKYQKNGKRYLFNYNGWISKNAEYLKWLDDVVVLTKGGPIYIGIYDMYGRIQYKNFNKSFDKEEEIDCYETDNIALHINCWKLLNLADYEKLSKSLKTSWEGETFLENPLFKFCSQFFEIDEYICRKLKNSEKLGTELFDPLSKKGGENKKRITERIDELKLN